MLHSLKTNIHCEEFSTTLARKLLNVTVLVVAYAPFDNRLRTAVDASVENDWFDNSCRRLFLNCELDLNSPNVLAHNIAILKVWASALELALSIQS